MRVRKYRAHLKQLQIEWQKWFLDKRLVLVAMRHPKKLDDGPPRRGIDWEGNLQANEYRAAVIDSLRLLFQNRWVELYAGDTVRTRQGLRILFAPLFGEGCVPVESPPELDMPDPGPRNADKWAGRRIAQLLGLERHEDAQAMEWEKLDLQDEAGRSVRFERQGEMPQEAERRIKAGLIHLIAEARKKDTYCVLFYCFNAPAGSDALGVVKRGHTVEPMETLFVSYDADKGEFGLLGSARPFTKKKRVQRHRGGRRRKRHGRH